MIIHNLIYFTILHPFFTLLLSLQSVGPMQVYLFAPKRCILCIKSGKNERKSENSAFSDVNCTLKTKSRRISHGMGFEGNFLGFQNIKSHFPQHVPFSQNGSIFEHRFSTKKLTFSALGGSIWPCKSPLDKWFLKNMIRTTSCPIYSPIGAFLPI